MSDKVPFQIVLDALLDESKPFPAKYLHRFSDIETGDLQDLLKVWPRILLRRKHALLEDLEDLTETDTLLSFEDLARSLLEDVDPQIRIGAIRLLWECDDKNLVPVYLSMLKNDNNDEVQAAAANALGQYVYLGELDKLPASTKAEVEEQLLAVVKSRKNLQVRRRSLESLGYSGHKEVVPLIESAYHEDNPEWVASALFAMGRSCDDRWKKAIVSKLRSPYEDIRSEASHAAGELGIGSARSVLLDMLEDEEDLLVRRELILALSKIGGEGVRAKLEELLEIEEDDEETDFIEESLDNLSLTEEMDNFDLIDVDPEVDFIEEESDEDK